MTIFIHTADWHLGKTFHAQAADPARQERLRLTRFAAIESLGAAARAAGAAAVLVAGDVFHTSAVDDRTVVAALDAIGRIGLPVVAIPGNHDHGGPGSVWERPIMREQRERRAPNLTVLLGEPCAHRVGDIDVLAIPIMDRFQAVRLRDLASVAAGDRPRIGLVHAPVDAFSEVDGGRALATDGAEALGLAYLALGDYHRQQAVTDLPMVAWYAGTHEPDNFPSHHQAGMRQGGCLRVEVSSQGLAVTPLRLDDGLCWARLAAPLRGDADLDRLEADLSSLSTGRAQRTLCRVEVEGSELSFAASARFRALIDRLAPNFELLAVDGAIREAPSDSELAGLTARSGLVGSAAERLYRLIEDPAQAPIARAALARLHRHGGS